MMKNPLANFVRFQKSFRFLQTSLLSTNKGHVLIAGGTGYIGRNLREFLLKENYKVTVISRNKTGEKHIINWADLIINGVPNNVTAVVNLTGEPIMVPFKDFGNNLKKKIWISRVGSTMLLTDIINSAKCKPNVFITITSTDIYSSDGEVHTEKFIPSDQMVDCNFFTRLGTDWEQASKHFPFRKVSIRTGTVLGDNGGFLKCLKYPTAIGLGAQIGDGCQHQPWIHICDLMNLILFSIENDKISGILNGVSPKGLTNGELTTIYTHLLKKSPVTFNIPRMILKTVFGEERTKLILEGRQVLPIRTLNYGFKYQYCEINDALKNILGQQCKKI